MSSFGVPHMLTRKLEHTALHASVLKTLDNFAWLPSRSLELFPDFTDHGPDHLRDVLGLATQLITNETYERLTPEDVATLVIAVLLHDLAMHITTSGFTELCLGRTLHCPIEPFDSESWPGLWSQFRMAARQWSDQDNYSIFGTTDPGLPPDLHTTDWPDMHRRFAGEFVRRYHARLAHEIAFYGFPNAGSPLSLLKLDDGIEHLADLAGLVGRSHGMDLRLCVDYLKSKSVSSKRVQSSNPASQKGARGPMKYMACIFMLGTFLCYAAAAAQMKLGDLYKLCTSSNEGDKSACRFYILGVFEGAQFAGGTVLDKSGNFQEAKDKRFCVPEGLDSEAMELTVKMKMGEDLAVFPKDRDMPAISFVAAVIVEQFPCQKTK